MVALRKSVYFWAAKRIYHQMFRFYDYGQSSTLRFADSFSCRSLFVLPEDAQNGRTPLPLVDGLDRSLLLSTSGSGTLRHRSSILFGPRLSCWEPVVFINFTSRDGTCAQDDSALLVDVAMRATATPVYYLAYQVWGLFRFSIALCLSPSIFCFLGPCRRYNL